MANKLYTAMVFCCALTAAFCSHGLLYGLDDTELWRWVAAALLPSALLPFLFLPRLTGPERPILCAAVFLVALPAWYFAEFLALLLALDSRQTTALVALAVGAVVAAGLVLRPWLLSFDT